MKAYLKRLKNKWEIQSNIQFWIIMLVFALTGSSILIIKPPLFNLLGIDGSLHWLLYGLLYILIITPVYVTMLMLIGSVLGQHRFFSRFLLRSIRRN
jgi:hypothetical protein